MLVRECRLELDREGRASWPDEQAGNRLHGLVVRERLNSVLAASTPESQARVVSADRVSNHFPPVLRDVLVRAAAIDNAMNRRLEIERIQDWAGREYPEHFRQDL